MLQVLTIQELTTLLESDSFGVQVLAGCQTRHSGRAGGALPSFRCGADCFKSESDCLWVCMWETGAIWCQCIFPMALQVEFEATHTSTELLVPTLHATSDPGAGRVFTEGTRSRRQPVTHFSLSVPIRSALLQADHFTLTVRWVSRHPCTSLSLLGGVTPLVVKK